MANVRKTVSAGCVASLAMVIGSATTVLGSAVARADPAAHQVTYTITSAGNLTGNVRYINSDPPSQSAFNANSAQYLSTVQTAFAGGQPLVYSATLADPNQWAFVSASGGCRWPDCGSETLPELRCEIAVDGQVVVTQHATTGVTCSTRPW